MWDWREGRRGEYGSMEMVHVFAIDGLWILLGCGALAAAWHWRLKRVEMYRVCSRG